MHSLTVFVARYVIILPLVIGVWVWLSQTRSAKKRFIIIAAAAAIVAVLGAKIGTGLVESPRPFIADHVVPYFSSARDNGFPSDHTLLAATAAFTILLFSRGWGLVCLALTIAIGVARVVAGVHHGRDVLGGIVIGGLAVAVGYGVQRLALRTKPTPEDDQSV